MSDTGEQQRGPAAIHHFALPDGTVLNEYVIEEVLGHGGFGITYRALDTKLNEEVALKEYFPNELAGRVATITVKAKSRDDLDDFSAGLAAFLEEARTITRFHHPNIVQVRRFFEMHGTGYIVLDYERGRTLSNLLQEVGTLSEGELRDLLLGLLAGLEVIHAQAVLHRDLKPSNIIMCEDGRPVLIDFGAARDFRGRQSRSVTAIAAPGYSPPEQYGVAGRNGPWTDLYALGAVAYRCATGKAPVDSLRRLRDDPLIPASEAVAGAYSANLLRTIDWMLEINDTDRPASVAEVRDALTETSPPPLPRRKPRPVTPWALAAGVALLAVGGTLYGVNPVFRQAVCDHVGLCTGPTTAEIRQRQQAEVAARQAAEREASEAKARSELRAQSVRTLLSSAVVMRSDILLTAANFDQLAKLAGDDVEKEGIQGELARQAKDKLDEQKPRLKLWCGRYADIIRQLGKEFAVQEVKTQADELKADFRSHGRDADLSGVDGTVRDVAAFRQGRLSNVAAVMQSLVGNRSWLER